MTHSWEYVTPTRTLSVGYWPSASPAEGRDPLHFDHAYCETAIRDMRANNDRIEHTFQSLQTHYFTQLIQYYNISYMG